MGREAGTSRASGDRAEAFKRTRAAHRDETAEDYVEAIAQLIDERGECRNRDLAKMFGVSHVTVVRIIKRLSEAGLVESQAYRPLLLTEAGRALGEASRRRHEVVLGFLRSIGVGKRQAEIDAEGIEHHVSDQTVRALRRVMERLEDGSGG